MARVRKDHKRDRLAQLAQAEIKQPQVLELERNARRVAEMHELEVLDDDRERHERDAENGEERREAERLEAAEERQRQHQRKAKQQNDVFAVHEWPGRVGAEKRLIKTVARDTMSARTIAYHQSVGSFVTYFDRQLDEFCATNKVADRCPKEIHADDQLREGSQSATISISALVLEVKRMLFKHSPSSTGSGGKIHVRSRLRILGTRQQDAQRKISCKRREDDEQHAQNQSSLVQAD